MQSSFIQGRSSFIQDDKSKHKIRTTNPRQSSFTMSSFGLTTNPPPLTIHFSMEQSSMLRYRNNPAYEERLNSTAPPWGRTGIA